QEIQIVSLRSAARLPASRVPHDEPATMNARTDAPLGLASVIRRSAVVAGAVLLGCGSPSSSPAAIGIADANAPDQTTSCSEYCQQQASIGSLSGSYQACVDDCCAAGPSRCADGAGPDGVSGADAEPSPPDAGGDVLKNPEGGPCAQPCGTACCGA